MSKLTYGHFERTGEQDAGNAFSSGDVDMDAGTPEEIFDAFIEHDEADFKKQWLEQQDDDWEGLDPQKCADAWFNGWKHVAIAEITEALAKRKQRDLDEAERWYLDVNDQVDHESKQNRLVHYLTEHAQIDLHAEPEDHTYEGEFDHETTQWIGDQLRQGNEWAWCQVRVTASYGGRVGHAFLGGCSYHGQQDFKRDDGYYPQLVHEAIAELASKFDPDEIDFLDSDILESFDTLEEAVQALARFKVGRVLYGDGNGPDFEVVRVATNGKELHWADADPHHPTTGRIRGTYMKQLNKLFEQERSEVVARGGFTGNPTPSLAHIMFVRNTVTARMLRDLARRGSMLQADFMSEYHERCERARPSKSSFLNNFGRFVIGSYWGGGGGTPYTLASADRKQSQPLRVIRQTSAVGVEGAASRHAGLLTWTAGTPDEMIRELDNKTLQAGYESLDWQLHNPRKTDDPDETAWWIQLFKAEIERRGHEAPTPRPKKVKPAVEKQYECDLCAGSGFLNEDHGTEVVCTDCGGTGHLKENPPWLTRAIADSFEGLEAKVKPAWLPKLDGVRAGRGRTIHAALTEYGCGAYGCVLPTLDPNVVLKATIDTTETEFARDMARSLVVPIVTKYFQVASIPAKHKNHRVYLLWREAADDVGGLKKNKAARKAIDRQHQAANAAYANIKEGEPFGRELGAWLVAVKAMAKVPDLAYVANGMVRVFEEQGIFIGDIHEGNLGLCKRDGKQQWVITDPGHVAVIKEPSGSGRSLQRQPAARHAHR